MMKILIAAALAAMMTATALAQESGQRGNWGGAAGNWGPRHWLNQMVAGFDNELGFDEQQWTQLDNIIDAQEERMRAAREHWREIGSAMAAGDEARAAELREQFQQQADGRDGGMHVMLGEIENVLNEDQLVRFQEMRQIMRKWREHGQQTWQAVREIPDAVGMTEEQRQDYQTLMQERWQAIQEDMRQRWEQGEGGMQWEMPDFTAMRDEFYGQVSELLNDDQKAMLGEYRAQFAADAPTVEQKQTADVRTLLKAMKRIRGLGNEQREELRKVERDALNSYQSLRRDKDRQAALAADVKSQITKVLNPTQTDEFNQILERLSPRRGRE